MRDRDPIAALIPWYANGTLSAEDRRTVEEHLPRCTGCQALLDQAREQMRWAAARPADACMEHVHPQLLVEYADHPERLDRETVSWIESRLSSCETCGEASSILRHLPRLGDEPPAPKPVNVLQSLARRFSLSILRPELALAYLVLLLVLTPAVWLVRSPSEGPVSGVTVFSTTGDRATRTEPRADAIPPPLELPASADAVLLRLETELVAADLADPRASFVVELHRGAETVWSRPKTGRDFVSEDGAVTLLLLLRPRGMDIGPEYAVVIRVHRPGDPLDGQAIFRKSLRIIDL